MAVGQLVEWLGERAIARGVDVAAGDVVSIDGAGQAIVCGLYADTVELAPLTTRVPPVGAGVRRIGPHLVATGPQLVGRTLDGNGEPIDGRGPLRCDTVHRVFARDPVTMPSVAPRRLTLGLLNFDLQLRFDEGAHVFMTGPREVAHHVMAHQHAAKRIVVIASPQCCRREHHVVRRPALPCIHVAASDDASSVQQWLVPWTGLAIADGLRARGHAVVVLIDDLDSWKPHLPHGLPRGSWATQLAQLASRAYALTSGSVSVFARAQTVTPAIAAAFDGIDLDLAAIGAPPLMSKLVRPPIKVPSRGILGHLVMQALTGGQRAREVLRYRRGMPFDSIEQLACALALVHVDELQAEAVGAFLEAYVPAMRTEHGDRLDKIRATGVLSDDDQRALLALAMAIAAPFLREARRKPGSSF
jgi:F0F1-type ATP synthase alpha subunit